LIVRGSRRLKISPFSNGVLALKVIVYVVIAPFVASAATIDISLNLDISVILIISSGPSATTLSATSRVYTVNTSVGKALLGLRTPPKDNV
jgi:hypothetical protein